MGRGDRGQVTRVRRRLVFGALVSVLLLATVAGPASAQQPAQTPTDQERAEQELAERHAPVLMLKPQQEECDSSGEQYAPMSVELLLDNPQILLRQIGTGDPVVLEGPSAADLHDRGRGFYLDFPGDALAPGCIYERDFKRYTRGQPAVVYAHVVGQDDAPNQLALQYWFFYYYNDYNNLHEGDWEGIQLLFDVGSAEEALGMAPVSIGYSQHFGGEVAGWDDPKLERRDDHPVVYPAVGSHASYFTPALYLGRSGSHGFGCDNTEGPSEAVEPDVVLLPSNVDGPDDPLAWNSFEGLWGERQNSGPFNGPTGPSQKERWTQPIDWHRTLRDSSVAVPDGADTSLPVVNSFCQVVGWGSARFIGFQQNPVPLIAAILAAGVAAMIALRRTNWTPVPALPIVSKRRLGQIIGSAARLYRDEPRHMIEIGLLYLPVSLTIGLVVLAVQQLLLIGSPQGSDANLGPIGLVVVGVTNTVGQTITAAVVTGTVALIINGLETGEELRGLAGYRIVIGRARDLLAAVGRTLIIVGLLLVSVVGVPWAIRQAVRYQFIAQATVLEGLGPKAALRRSTELVQGRWLHTAAAILILAGLISLTGAAFGLLLLVALPGLPLWLFSVVVNIGGALVVPLSSTAAVLLYGNARAEQQDQA